jgi:hypothetical protein
MNANLKKLIGSAAALLTVGAGADAQTKSCSCAPTTSCCTFEQGLGLCNEKFPAAYNAPARIDVQCSWDLFLTGSFIYWRADQEAMDFAYARTARTSVTTGSPLTQDFDFKPGFQVGLGFNFEHDNWVTFLEYTWLHQTTCTGSSTAPAGYALYPTSYMSSSQPSFVSASSKWKSSFDILDATVGRPYYLGRKLTVNPYGGLRAAWIRQNFRVSTDANVVSHNRSNSWGIGSKLGLESHWLLDWGFRVEGDVAGSLLYTKYTSVAHRETISDVESYASLDCYGTVRPMADMSLGLAWGSYFDRQNYYFDLGAFYDFKVMWSQNMMRYLANSANNGANAQPGDLHLQGLTVKARFDF